MRLLLALTMKNLALLATNLRDDVLRLAVAEAVRLQSERCQQQKTEETGISAVNKQAATT